MNLSIYVKINLKLKYFLIILNMNINLQIAKRNWMKIKMFLYDNKS